MSPDTVLPRAILPLIRISPPPFPATFIDSDLVMTEACEYGSASPIYLMQAIDSDIICIHGIMISSQSNI